jgi:hypothetical protein
MKDSRSHTISLNYTRTTAAGLAASTAHLRILALQPYCIGSSAHYELHPQCTCVWKRSEQFSR